jgi:magnesium-transporting ATPase (P-type)
VLNGLDTGRRTCQSLDAKSVVPPESKCGLEVLKGLLMTFWQIIWFIFVAYVFFAYLMVLFSVISDIFRNRESSGLAKAVWIVLLILFPIIIVIIYLIVDGKAMAERSAARSLEMQAQQESYIKGVAGKSPADQVTQAKSLLDSGAISQAEYESMKAKALS